MKGIPQRLQASPTRATYSSIRASSGPVSATKTTTASAPDAAASSTEPMRTIWFGIVLPVADAVSIIAQATSFRYSATVWRANPTLIMMTLAPPRMASRRRAPVSASGERNAGDVIP